MNTFESIKKKVWGNQFYQTWFYLNSHVEPEEWDFLKKQLDHPIHGQVWGPLEFHLWGRITNEPLE